MREWRLFDGVCIDLGFTALCDDDIGSIYTTLDSRMKERRKCQLELVVADYKRRACSQAEQHRTSPHNTKQQQRS